MKNLLVAIFMFTLYWPGTHTPLRIGDPVRIICGEYDGKHGKVNYTWQDGSVDVIYVNLLTGIHHYYIRDLECLRRND